MASRRLQELPDRAATRLTFRPEPDGFVTVTAAIAERRGPPRSAIEWTAAAAQAGLEREAKSASPARPDRRNCGQRAGAGGIVVRGSRSGLRCRKVRAFAVSGGSTPAGNRKRTTAPTRTTFPLSLFDERRTHASLTVSDWLTPRIRYSVTGGADAWRGRSYSGRTALAGGALEYRWLDDRLAVSGTATAWMPASFVRSGVRARLSIFVRQPGLGVSRRCGRRSRERFGAARHVARRGRRSLARTPAARASSARERRDRSGPAIGLRPDARLHPCRSAALVCLRPAGACRYRGFCRRRTCVPKAAVHGRRRSWISAAAFASSCPVRQGPFVSTSPTVCGTAPTR